MEVNIDFEFSIIGVDQFGAPGSPSLRIKCDRNAATSFRNLQWSAYPVATTNWNSMNIQPVDSTFECYYCDFLKI